MKRNMYLKLTFCILLGLAVSPAFAWQPPKPQPFSGDFTQTTDQGKQVTGKIYFALPKMRLEMNTGGREMILIIDQSAQTSDVLMPEQHMYMENHTNQDNPMMRGVKAPTSFDPDHPCGATATCNKVGTETINGRVCDKWVNTDSKGTTTAWIDQSLHFPIKTQNANGSIWQLTNIKEGEPDASVFQVPAGYRKMDIPAMMGGGRPQR